ncbi:MAG TPA: hypothetical protein VMN57_11000 [Anaerolineales bacterium]|nr:hypothetical protein [Anaerolineales bacterium]
MDRGGPDNLFNFLTLLVLVGVGCIGLWFVSIFLNPQTSVNPFKPIVPLPTATVTVTPTATLPLLVPTFTPQATATAQPTFTPNPTATPLPTFTPFSIVTPPTGEPTTAPDFAYVPFDDHPLAIQNVVHQDLGCNWMGVGGQVIDERGAPILGLVVQLFGTLAGRPIDMLTLTGTAAQFGYGPSGYEFKLADEPVPSSSEMYVQLLDQSGAPLSGQILFTTFADCNRNLILISFVSSDN